MGKENVESQIGGLTISSSKKLNNHETKPPKMERFTVYDVIKYSYNLGLR